MMPLSHTLFRTLIPFECCKCTVFYIEVNLKNSLYTDVVLFFFSLATLLLWRSKNPVRFIFYHPRSMEHISTSEITILSYTVISKKVVGKNVHATISKGNMGYDQYTVPDTVAVEPMFVTFV